MNPEARPSIDPLVLSSILSSAPERLQKRLDREPRAAEAWPWAGVAGEWKIHAGEETVQILANVVTEVSQVRCSCLLSPRCFHVLAVLSLCEICDASAAKEDASTASEGVPMDDAAPSAARNEETQELSPSARRAVQQTEDATARMLATGLRSAGTVQQSLLLRAIHECRSEGLHRLAASGLRLMTDLKQLRGQDQDFRSETAVEDFRETLETCRHLLQTDHVPQRWLGVARREFLPIDSLKLQALFCEPILTRSGYAGVVTWFIADDGWIGSVSDVQPGDAKRIPQAWQSGVTLAGLSLSHRKLSHQGLLVSRGTRSADGRLGGGESARAVAVTGDGWNASSVIARFREPLLMQIKRAFEHSSLPDFLKPAGNDLIFFEAIILGYHEHELIIRVHDQESMLHLTVAHPDDSLCFRDSLQTLAAAPGLSVRCMGRIEFKAAGRIQLLAVSPPLESQVDSPAASSIDNENHITPRLRLPEGATHFSIGLQRIEKNHLTRSEKWPVRIPVAAAAFTTDAFDDSVERWLSAVATGGRHAIPQTLAGSAARDVARLRSHSRSRAADLLSTLVTATMATKIDVRGIRSADVPQHLATHWLAAAISSRSVQRQLHCQDWLSLVDPQASHSMTQPEQRPS